MSVYVCVCICRGVCVIWMTDKIVSLEEGSGGGSVYCVAVSLVRKYSACVGYEVQSHGVVNFASGGFFT